MNAFVMYVPNFSPDRGPEGSLGNVGGEGFAETECYHRDDWSAMLQCQLHDAFPRFQKHDALILSGGEGKVAFTSIYSSK